MRFENLVRAFGQALGEAMAENGKFRFDSDEEEWDRLEDFAFQGAAPDRLKVALGRGDVVRVTPGSALAIEVTGDDDGVLRYRLMEDTLKIVRRRGSASGATITLTMPPLRKLAIAGSGTVEAETLAEDSAIAIGGSGAVHVTRIAGKKLAAKIGGSGTIKASGNVREFALRIGGAGRVIAPELEVEKARIAIGGSGKVEFASDGEVDARIGGAGDILVHGTPRCSLKAGGSGRLRTIPRGGSAEDEAA